MASSEFHPVLVRSVSTMLGDMRFSASQEDDQETAEHSTVQPAGPADRDVTKTHGNNFTLFARLPKELRLQIWSHAVPGRIIPLHRTEGRSRGRAVYFSRSSFSFMALTTKHRSLDILQRVCPEAKLLCQRSYLEWEVWDIQTSQMGTPYSPDRDVIYFSAQISASILLDFADQFPLETSSMRALALPGVLGPERASRLETLAALHAFEKLREVVIVLGKATPENTTAVLWQGGSALKSPWVLPAGIEDAFEQLKKERWPDWKLPTVVIVKSQAEIPGI